MAGWDPVGAVDCKLVVAGPALDSVASLVDGIRLVGWRLSRRWTPPIR